MARPNFFVGLDETNHLLKAGAGDRERGDVEFTVDLTWAPYTLLFTADDAKAARSVILHERGEIRMLERLDERTERVRLTIQRGSEEERAILDHPDMEEDPVKAFFAMCVRLSAYIQDNDLERLYRGLDPDEAGILLTVEGDELTAKAVAGKERPDLLCTTLFGEPQMTRPYIDEVADQFFSEGLEPLEDKIAAAEAGDAEKMRELAFAYLSGDGVDPDPAQAAHWFRELAETGEPKAMFNLALFYAKGYGVERDFAQAAYWMERAANCGDEDAPDEAKAFRKMADGQSRAEAGDAQAQADLASGLMKLGGLLQDDEDDEENEDYVQAVYWAKKAAQQDNVDALWVLGLAYEHGRGVKQNDEMAKMVYNRGSELDHAPCLQNLACYYLRDDQTPGSHQEGFRLLLRAAELGHGPSMKQVGHCYQFGDGVEENMDKAMEWYEKALEVMGDDEELAERVAIFKEIQEQGGFLD